MSEAQVAGSLDRLPWLTNEPRPRVERGKRRDLTGWMGASVLLVAAVSFWLGSRAPTVETLPPPTATAGATVAVPEPRPAPDQEVRVAPQPEVAQMPVPEVRPVSVPQVRIAPPPPRKIITADVAKQVASDSLTAPAAPEAASPTALAPSPPRVTEGAYGRLVEIGAYGSPIQAKRGWAAMVQAYPAVAHLQAGVVETRNSKGRPFYRFQIGTTSQAHSEVLCQRMQKIELSCAVVGLPWKAKVER